MKPIRCVDPVMKCCQYCEYGHIEYPHYPDIDDFDAHCIYGFEECEPTEEEIREFEDWCVKHYELQ